MKGTSSSQRTPGTSGTPGTSDTMTKTTAPPVDPRHKNYDWTKAKIAPKDVSVMFGKPMTPEEFDAHCQKTGIRPQVISKKL